MKVTFKYFVVFFLSFLINAKSLNKLRILGNVYRGQSL